MTDRLRRHAESAGGRPHAVRRRGRARLRRHHGGRGFADPHRRVSHRAGHARTDGRGDRRRGARHARRHDDCDARRRAPSICAAPAATATTRFNISTATSLVVAGLRRAGGQARQSQRLLAHRHGRCAGSAGRQDRRAAGCRRSLSARGRLRLPVRARLSQRHEACGTGAPRTGLPHHLQSARARSPTRRRSSASCWACSRPNGSRPLAHVLKELGTEKAWVVHGSDGLDELTTTGPTTVAVLENGAVTVREVTPEEIGVARVPLSASKGGEAEEQCGSADGAAGRRARRLPRCRAAQQRRGAGRRRQGGRSRSRRNAARPRPSTRGAAKAVLARLAAASQTDAGMTILDKIAAYKRDEIAAAKARDAASRDRSARPRCRCPARFPRRA